MGRLDLSYRRPWFDEHDPYNGSARKIYWVYRDSRLWYRVRLGCMSLPDTLDLILWQCAECNPQLSHSSASTGYTECTCTRLHVVPPFVRLGESTPFLSITLLLNGASSDSVGVGYHHREYSPPKRARKEAPRIVSSICSTGDCNRVRTHPTALSASSRNSIRSPSCLRKQSRGIVAGFGWDQCLRIPVIIVDEADPAARYSR